MKISEQLAIQRMYSAQVSRVRKPPAEFSREVIEGTGEDEFSREVIEGMSKDELVEMFAAHGVKVSRRKSAATLRAELIALMFVDM